MSTASSAANAYAALARLTNPVGGATKAPESGGDFGVLRPQAWTRATEEEDAFHRRERSSLRS